jgi:DNA-binding GntR family transcriptional regulator
MATRKAKSDGKNAQATAYAHLKERIRAGVLPGGAQISPAETGKVLGISRMPVREALLQLEAEGLIRFGLNRRPIVTALTPKEIMELFEIRIALEQLAVVRAVTRITPSTFADLSLHLVRMDHAKPDPHAWLELHDEFHDRIYAAADMPKLMEEIARLRESIRPYLLMYTSFFEQPEVTGCEHSVLLEVIKQRDPNAAQHAIAKHIRTGASYLVNFLMNNQAPTHILVDAEAT